MKELIVKIAPFILKQSVYIRDIETGEIKEECIPQKELAHFISLQQDIKEIHLFGHEKFVKKIQEECMYKYNMKDFVFKINE